MMVGWLLYDLLESFKSLVFQSCCDGRVVKALDLKSNGVSPRRFDSCSQRLYFLNFLHNRKPCIGLRWHQKQDKRQTRPWGKKIKKTTSLKKYPFQFQSPTALFYLPAIESDFVPCRDRSCKQGQLFSVSPHILRYDQVTG